MNLPDLDDPIWLHEPMDFWANGYHWQECQEDHELWPCKWKQAQNA